MFDIEAELKKLPKRPGVYLMKDKNDRIIYVGKAVSLKNRVTQYFRKNNKTKRIQNMVSLIDHFEYIVTDNEAEALILECNLIKKNMPKFNVLLKDDKTYPYIKINIKDDYPNIYITRRILNDGAKYFGPYANSTAAKEIINFIKEKFKIRQCKNFKYKDRACLNYQIKKCFAPCMGYISKEEYREQINQIVSLLDGKIEKILKQLHMQMDEASKQMEYEKAAYIRDKINAIEKISEGQKVSNLSENDIDVIGLYKNDYEVCIEVFIIRNSKMIEREHYIYKGLKDEEDEVILSEFMKQYYVNKEIVPSKIMMREEIQDKAIITEWLSTKCARKVDIKTPQKGEKLKLVEMAENNARITLNNRENTKNDIVKDIKKMLNIDIEPRKIESFDISNISGQYLVAGMCVMENGIIRKNKSKIFKIKTVIGQDDPKCMEEVITRRLKHSIGEKDNFGELPDLIFVDGGITQIKAALKAIKKYDLNISVYGMVKDNKHRTRALIDSEKNEIELSEELMNLITVFQDTVHDIAIGYHKKLRDKSIIKSELDDINGIGDKKKQELLKYFGSIKKIKEATVEDLSKVKGINRNLANEIKEKLS